eukprot:TRINITY_DN1007_c0_g1_i2.p1 TRINITY_DN1007_c0_g1~~TRINITY_DN1007_c0_g1_i2.p1  ORF type:complete len:274 (-),score=60.07 TRINITY_DN1007_c0_g1_i2:342-1163(-)
MVRSILLRGFDQQMSGLIGNYMQQHGTKFIHSATPTQIVKLEDGKLVVTYLENNTEKKEVYDTVLFATGRYAVTQELGLDKIGVQVNKNLKIKADKYDQTTVPNIYSIGDCTEGRPELTPTAIKAGKLLARRLYNGESKVLSYDTVATTVFTPLEYGTIGLSEEAAVEKYGESNIEVYHSYFQPLEYTVPHRPDNTCYVKIICNKNDNERVVGFHICSPNAGEITQGISVAMSCGVTKEQLDSTIGIHPTVAEELVLLNITKRSGKSAEKSGC